MGTINTMCSWKRGCTVFNSGPGVNGDMGEMFSKQPIEGSCVGFSKTSKQRRTEAPDLEGLLYFDALCPRFKDACSVLCNSLTCSCTLVTHHSTLLILWISVPSTALLEGTGDLYDERGIYSQLLSRSIIQTHVYKYLCLFNVSVPVCVCMVL